MNNERSGLSWYAILIVLLIIFSILNIMILSENAYGEEIITKEPNTVVRGTVHELNGIKITNPVVRIANLSDIRTGVATPLADIKVNDTTGEFYYEFKTYGSFQIFATSLNCHTSSVVNITAVQGKTIWLNFTLTRREKITGIVMDAEDKPLETVTIKMRQPDGKNLMLSTSDTGKYTVLVSSGIYNFTIYKPGYYTVMKDVTISPGQWVDMNFTLEKIPEKKEELNILHIAGGVCLMILVLITLVVFFYMKARAKRIRETPTKEDLITDMECPGCGEALKKGVTQCHECGYRFTVRCPDCGKEQDKKIEKCVRCGFEIYKESSS